VSTARAVAPAPGLLRGRRATPHSAHLNHRAELDPTGITDVRSRFVDDGALITSADIIGTRGITPVRALINEAASLVPAERLALCLVVTSGSTVLHSNSFGTPESAWAAH